MQKNNKDMAQDNEKEWVNHPQHYNQGGIECFDVMRAYYGEQAFEGFCLCSTLKYVMRCRNKDKYLEDLKKAQVYIQEIIKLHDGKE